MNRNPSITVEHVEKRFGPQTVLRNISFEVFPREIFGLLGPSGAGKTTLIRLIAGMDQADGGRIRMGGQTMPHLQTLGEIGYMTQSDALYQELKGWENLTFFASLYGLKGSEKKRRIEETAELVQLTNHLDKYVYNYSGGMKRRLSLAAALLHRPRILILDEPTVGIDPHLRKSIWDALHRHCEEGTTVLVTTHVMDEAEKCHRLGMLRDGQLLAEGSPAELKEQTQAASLEDAFLYFSTLSEKEGEMA